MVGNESNLEAPESKLVQAEDLKSGSNIPHDVDEGINTAKVNDEVVVHRVDCECQVNSIEDPAEVIRLSVYYLRPKGYYRPQHGNLQARESGHTS